MAFKNDDFGIFLKLGLTMQQAKVYIALIKLEQATAKTIAKTAQMQRAEIYRVAPKLQKLGLIKKIIANPISFRATPLHEGLTILLQREAERNKIIQNEAQQFLLNFKNHNEEKPNQENGKYNLTVGSKPVIHEYLRELSEAQTSKDCIHNWRTILFLVNRDFEYFKKALKKGVRIRYITYAPEGTKMPESIQTLAETGSFEVKFVSAIPKAHIDIFDKKILHIITHELPPLNVKGTEVLRSNNPAVVELAQDYFELKWQSATTIC